MCLESHSRARFALQRRKVVLGHPVAKLAKLGFGSRYNSALFFFFFLLPIFLKELCYCFRVERAQIAFCC